MGHFPFDSMMEFFFEKKFKLKKKNSPNFQNKRGFFPKMWGYLKKVGIFFRKCGDFEKNKKWGFVGIFASGGGDFQSESSGNTVLFSLSSLAAAPG